MNKDKINISKITLKLLEKKLWNKISLEEVKKLNKNSLSIKNKNQLLENINRYFDYLLKNNLNSIENSSSKDMIFEVLMMRFDLLNQYRPQIIKIFNLLKKKPQYSIRVLPSFIDSMNKMLKKSKIETTGIKGNLKIKGLLVIYFSTFLTWINDESESLDKTMMKLDDNLEKSAKLIKLIDK